MPPSLIAWPLLYSKSQILDPHNTDLPSLCALGMKSRVSSMLNLLNKHSLPELGPRILTSLFQGALEL